MKLLAPAILIAMGAAVNAGSENAAAGSLPSFPATQSTTMQNTGAASPEPGTIVVPPGTKVTLALTSPVWAKTAKAGDAIYAVTAFPVTGNGMVAIPAGTYVLGEIDAITKPRWLDANALFQMHFSKIIFGNGYTVELASAPIQAATATVHVKVSSRNDVLLDNGAQFDMIVQMPVALESARVAQAVRQTRPAAMVAAKSASLCRAIPGTPGTSDTVIPGTPGSPGTPDITIPGPDGTTTTIPGIPPTDPTPPTIIPGTPGTPAIPCPAAPEVVSGASGPQIHTQSFQVTNQLVVSGKKLAPGNYQVVWQGTDAAVEAELQQSGKTIARAPAHIAVLSQNAPADKIVTRTNADGSVTIDSLEFAGQGFAVIFD